MKRISRDNYEEYFLLYADHELSATEKNAVDEFVSANPDLRSELMMHFQLKVKPDQNISFGNKDLLRQNNEVNLQINLNNCQTFFLLYADNELDQKDRKMVEDFVQKDLGLLKELEIILQARMEPDMISFPGKDILYRKKERRIILVPWMRFAAAAVVLLSIGLFILWNSEIISNGTSVASTKPFNDGRAGHVSGKSDPAKKIPQPVTSSPVDSLNSENTISKKATVNKSVNKMIEHTNESMHLPQDELPREVALLQADSPEEVVSALKINRPLQKMDNPAVDEISGPELASGTMGFLALEKNENNAFEENPEGDETQFDQLNTSAKKNKFRGFFRKVSRAFNKTAHVDSENSDAILIGSFRVALK